MLVLSYIRCDDQMTQLCSNIDGTYTMNARTSDLLVSHSL